MKLLSRPNNFTNLEPPNPNIDEFHVAQNVYRRILRIWYCEMFGRVNNPYPQGQAGFTGFGLGVGVDVDVQDQSTRDGEHEDPDETVEELLEKKSVHKKNVEIKIGEIARISFQSHSIRGKWMNTSGF